MYSLYKQQVRSENCFFFNFFNNFFRLKTIGTVENKLTVQANEELFQATKEKVNKEAEEEKKNSYINDNFQEFFYKNNY